MKTIRRKGWQEDRDGVPFIYKDPDSNTFYEISVTIKGTSIASGPTWKTNGVIISNDTSSITGSTLTFTLQVKNTGRATVSFTDNLGNDEVETFEWKHRDR